MGITEKGKTGMMRQFGLGQLCGYLTEDGIRFREIVRDDEFIWEHVELELPERHLERLGRKSNLRIWNSGGESSP